MIKDDLTSLIGQGCPKNYDNFVVEAAGHKLYDCNEGSSLHWNLVQVAYRNNQAKEWPVIIYGIKYS
jgi:hypothetical protein